MLIRFIVFAMALQMVFTGSIRVLLGLWKRFRLLLWGCPLAAGALL